MQAAPVAWEHALLVQGTVEVVQRIKPPAMCALVLAPEVVQVALVLVIIHVPAVVQVAVMDHVVPVHIIAVLVQVVPDVVVVEAVITVAIPVVTLHVPVAVKEIVTDNAHPATDAAPAVVVTAHVQWDAIAVAMQVRMRMYKEENQMGNEVYHNNRGGVNSYMRN